LIRPDGRRADELRPVTIQRRFTVTPPGSVLITTGNTQVLCTASIEESVPPFLEETQQGWITAEYGMLPGSTPQRKPRGQPDGRMMEIRRLIGRSMRAAIDLASLGHRTIWIDCDVLQADGGTRAAGVTGAYVALVDALRWMRRQKLIAKLPPVMPVAAVSVGMVKGRPALDLCYAEDAAADVDFNVVMTGDGRFVEVQGTAEREPFDEAGLRRLLRLARKGINQLFQIQRAALRKRL
jgi:ribonuclease PH